MSQLLRQGKNLNIKRITTIMSLLMVAVMFLTFSGTALATGGPNEDCPQGTVQVAKFNVSNGGSYSPEGSANGVVISNGTVTGANWTSTKAISRVIVKGGSGPIAIKNYDYNPPANSGSFNNTGLQNQGGQTPNISNVKFCGPQPPKPGKIRVFKYYDEDKDQKWDHNEDELEDWEFTVTGTNYEEDDDTDDDGEAKFDNVPPGTYEVCETLQEGWANTTPLCQPATVESEKTTTLYFGNFKPLDPEFLCWVQKNSNTYRGYFGYINHSGITLHVEETGFSGDDWNEVSPLLTYNGLQPEDFLPGSHLSFTSPAFYVDFGSSTTVTWKLTGQQASTSTHSSKRCKFELEVEKIWEGGTAPGAINDLITLSNGNSMTCDWTGSALDCDPDSIFISAVLNNQGNPTAYYDVSENTGLLPTGWSLKSGTGDFSIPNEHLECVGKSCTHTVVNKYTPPSSITIKKVTTPESNVEFSFKDYNGQNFPVVAGGFKLFENLPAGDYSFSENTPPTGWKFEDLECENVTYVENGSSVSFYLPAGVNATCTFYNSNPESSIKVTKEVVGDTSLPEPGGDFTYKVTVKNTSPYNTVTIDSLVDDKFGDLIALNLCAAPTPLAPNGVYECEFTVAINEDILPGGLAFVHTNKVTASGKDDEGNPVSGDDDATVTITNVPSSIKVEKTPDPTQVNEPGDTVTYSVKVTNTSAVDDVTITSLVDDKFGDLTGNPLIANSTCVVGAVLAPLASYSCTFDAEVEGNGNTTHVNIVTVTGTDDDSQNVKGEGSATVNIIDTIPGITVIKDADVTELLEPGGPVEFTVTVINDSNEVVTIDSLVDDQFGNLDNVGTCAVEFVLQPANAGDTDVYTCSFTAQVTGVPGDEHVNEVTASGYDDEQNPVSGSDTATVKITDVASAITVIKEADPTQLPEPGGNFEFTVTVINNSATDVVTIDSLVDDKFGDLNGEGSCAVPFDLQPANAGDTDEYTCSFTETINGVSGDEHVNTVTAKGTDDDGEAVENSDDETVKIVDPLKGTIIVKKKVEGTDKTDSFEFTTSFAGTIYVNGGAQKSYSVDPDDGFSVAEVEASLPDYYSHKSTTCVSNVNGTVNPDDFSVAPEETVTCTTINIYEPPQCEGLRKDLTGRIEIVGLEAHGYVKNNTDRDCFYQVGIASYKKFNEILKEQVLWDYTNPPSILIPANTEILAVKTTIPECATQVDLFYGSVILDFSGGAKYGSRLLAYLHLPGTGYCETREQEQPKDTDGDGTIDRSDTDDDDDGLSDAEERDLGTDPKSPDTDGDKLTDFEEVRIHQTNPLSKDTDGDGLRDDKDSEPTVFNDLDGDGIGDGDDDQDNRDSDGDGLENWEDAEPDTFNDADCDGTGDGDDTTFDDLDGDGIGDGCDDQDNRDSDGDGLENWEDAEPDTFNDLDGDGIGDGNDDQDNRDSDGDGLENWEDAEPDVFNDADGDGVGDGNDICAAGDDNVDEDGNGTPDACDEPDGGEEATPDVGGGRRAPEIDNDVIKSGRNRE